MTQESYLFVFRKLNEGAVSSSSNEVLKKLTEELNKLQTDYNLRLTNSRLSLRSISTNKSDEAHDKTEVVNSVRNLRKLLQEYERYVVVYIIEKFEYYQN